MYFYTINQCLRLFGMAGVNPDKKCDRTQVTLYLMVVITTFSVIYLNILLLFNKDEPVTLIDITNVSESFGILIHGIFKLSILFFKRSKVCDLLKRMKHEFWKIEDLVNPDERTQYLNFLQFIKNAFHVFICSTCLTTISFTCRTIVLDGNYLPFESYNPKWIPFPVLWLYESLVFVLGVYIPIIGLDLFVFSILMLTKMQFKLLNREIKHIFHSETDVKIVEQRIKRCARHHDFLIDYIKRINDTFSETMLFYIGIVIISMCVEMYIISSQNAFNSIVVKAITYTFAGLFEWTICYCMPAQAVTDEADEVLHSIYFSKWYEFTQSMIMSLQIIMVKAQQKTLITAGKVINIDMETGLKGLKSMVSYFMFLQNMSQQ